MNTLHLQWTVSQRHVYCAIPLAGLSEELILRGRDLHKYPYCLFPDIPCHVTPIFAIIDAGHKLSTLALSPDEIARKYYILEVDIQERATLTRRLTTMRSIWALFESVRLAAKNWEDSMLEKKRKREPDDTETSLCTT